MIVYLVRHARAGHRATWQGEDDSLRPLDERGRRQADALVAQLADREFARILSSPFARCVQTVEPLAEARGLPVEAVDSLAEGAGKGPRSSSSAASTHRRSRASTATSSRRWSARARRRARRSCSR